MSLKDLSPVNRAVVTSWWNRWHAEAAGQCPDSMDWLESRDIIRDINTRLNVRTKRKHLSVLCNALGKLGKDAERAEAYIEYQKADEAVRRLDETQARPEDWTPLEEIMDFRDALGKPAPGLTARQAQKRHFQWLSLCMYTMQPPIRTEYCDMRIVSHHPLDRTRNFLLRQYPDSYTVILHKDKVVKHYGPANLDLSPALGKIISESLRLYPRDYLMINQCGNPFSPGAYSTFLSDIIPGKRIGVMLLRSAYITWFYEHNRRIMARKALAQKMRHDRLRAELSYNRPDDTEVVNPDNTPKTAEEIAEGRRRLRAAQQAVRRLNKRGAVTPPAEFVQKHRLYKSGGRWNTRVTPVR